MKRVKSIFWFIFIIIYLELIYKGFVFNNILSLNTLRIILFSLPISLFLYFICNLYSKKVNYILSLIFTVLITILFGAQLIYYAYYESIFSVFSLTAGTVQVFGFITGILDMMLRNWIPLLLMILPCILYLIFSHKVFSYNRLKTKALIISVIIIHFLYNSQKKQYFSIVL